MTYPLMSPVAVGGIIYNNYGFVNNESNPSKMGTLDPNIQEYGSYAVTIIYCEVPLRTWTCGNSDIFTHTAL